MYSKKYLFWLLLVGLSLLQIIRLVSFISVYGGLEHDSGWALGTARTLAETGTYAAMVSTIIDPAPGGHINIYERYKAQDEQGRIFFAPDSIGPASIIPNAIMIKLFGADFWPYRTASLLFLFLSLLLASYLLYQVAGVLPILITHLFLFFYPHLIIYLGYDTLGEIYGLAYMLLAFVLVNLGLKSQKYRWLWFLACGLAAGLAITSKLVALLALSGLVVVCALSYREKRMGLKEIVILMLGWISPYVLWETYQFLTLTRLFDLQTYLGFKAQLWQFFVRGGSGVNVEGTWSLGFVWEKLLIIREITSPYPFVNVVVFLFVLLGGPFLIWRLDRDTVRRNLIVFLWSGWFVTWLWFILLSQNGWVRHAWYALIFTVLLLSLLVTYFWQQVNRSPQWLHRGSALLLTGLLLFGFVSQINTPDFFTAQRLVDRWYQRRLATTHTPIPWIIIPRDQQNEALAIIDQLPPSAHIFYPEGYKAAEIPTLTGRMTYPLNRRPYIGSTAEDILIITPGLISPWAKLYDKPMTIDERNLIIDSVRKEIKQRCPQVVFENDYYIICSLN